MVRDGQERAWLVRIAKQRLGRDTFALCRYMWKQIVNAVGREKLNQLKDAALSAVNWHWRLKGIPSRWCREVLEQPSRTRCGKNNLSPLMLELDQFTRKGGGSPKGPCKKDLTRPKTALAHSGVAGCAAHTTSDWIHTVLTCDLKPRVSSWKCLAGPPAVLPSHLLFLLKNFCSQEHFVIILSFMIF